MDRVQTMLLGDLNHEVIKIILDMKHDEFKSKSFSSLIKTYMEASLKNLELCCALENSIRRAKYGLSIIRHRLQEAVNDGDQNKSLMMTTKEELMKLKTDNDPFPQELYQLFNSTHHGFESLVLESNNQREEFDKRLKRIMIWCKLSTVLFAVGYFSVLIFTGVTLVIDVPSPVEVLAGALLATVGSIGKWTNYYNKQEEKRIRQLKGCLDPVRIGAHVLLKETENLRGITDKWKVGVEGLVLKVDAVLKGEEKMKEIMKDFEVIEGIIEELSGNVDKVCMDTKQARVIPLEKIIQINTSEEEKMNCLEIIM